MSGEALVAILLHRRRQTASTSGGMSQSGRRLRGGTGASSMCLVEDAHEVVGVNGTSPGEHVVHDAADRVDVDAVVGRLPCACSGDMYSGVPKIIPVCVSARAAVLVGVDDLGDAEVEHLDEVGPPLALDEVDVLRLHVAVDDAVARARRRSALGDLHQDRPRALPVHRAGLLERACPDPGRPGTPSRRTPARRASGRSR